MPAIFATSYFPPAIQYSEYLKTDEIWIEGFEHFPKQTFRNRSYIMTANGIFMLSIPLESRKNLQYTKDIKISHAEDWQKVHWRTISNAYQKSPFYEFYDHKIERLFNLKKHQYLLDLNFEIEECIDKILKLEIERKLTTEYLSIEATNWSDFRTQISPKNKVIHNQIIQPNYLQVFADKHPFEKNLSILDVIFNLGTESVSHLKQMTLKS